MWRSLARGPPDLVRRCTPRPKGLKTVVLESYAPGGQAGSSSLIENFFGLPDRHWWRLFNLARSTSGLPLWREIFDTITSPLPSIQHRWGIPRVY